MSDLSLSRTRVAARPRRLPWPAILCAAVGTAGLAGVLTGRLASAETGGMEWQLVFLLRFMAAVKAGLVLGALGLAQWRLRRPASDRLAAGYGLALAAMAAAPGLIWSLSAIASGAACFHAGLLLYLVLAWRDEAVLPKSRPAKLRA